MPSAPTTDTLALASLEAASIAEGKGKGLSHRSVCRWVPYYLANQSWNLSRKIGSLLPQGQEGAPANRSRRIILGACREGLIGTTGGESVGGVKANVIAQPGVSASAGARW
jgi:hypothetical protein